MLAGLIAIPVLPLLGWRVLFAVGGIIPLIVGILLVRFLPESPRYLAQRPARWPELSRILRHIDPRIRADAPFIDSAEVPIRQAPATTLFARGLFRDTCALWSAFFFCLLAVYSGFNWLPSMLTQAGLGSIANTGITAYNLGGVVGAIVGAVAIKRFGSRVTMLAIAALASVIALGMRSMTFTSLAPALPIIVMLAVIGSLINAVQVTMYALGAYIYPTIARSTGVGVASSVGRLGAILSTYAGAWALENGGSSAFFTLIAAAMLAVMLSLAAVRRHIPGTAGLTAANLSMSN
jgi:AAHS family 4-hydroxybenzoate transporter-like MFS transporter